MATATRYSGFLTIKCRMDDFDDVHCTVSHCKNVIGRVKTRPPRSGVTDPKTHRRVADDSAVAFDQYAHAALSFVSDSDAEEADMIESLADFTDSGYRISRRKPVRKAAPNGRDRNVVSHQGPILGRKTQARSYGRNQETWVEVTEAEVRRGYAELPGGSFLTFGAVDDENYPGTVWAEVTGHYRYATEPSRIRKRVTSLSASGRSVPKHRKWSK